MNNTEISLPPEVEELPDYEEVEQPVVKRGRGRPPKPKEPVLPPGMTFSGPAGILSKEEQVWLTTFSALLSAHNSPGVATITAVALNADKALAEFKKRYI